MPKAAAQSDPIATLTRSVDLLVRMKVHEIKAERSQREMIKLLFEMGARNTEIASMLNLKSTTVDPELSKLRKGGSAKPKRKARQ